MYLQKIKVKKYILFLVVFLKFSFSYSQKEITLSAPQTGQVENVASDLVKFIPGYSFKATSTDWMRGYLSPNLITGKEYSTGEIDNDITQRNLDTDKGVGSISGEGFSNALGGAGYNINIDIPQGVNNLTPDLSISYSAQAGNSILGLGWSLNAVSSIYRTFKNRYYDNDITTVKYNNNDVFVLDGQRLFPNNSNGLDGTTYETEQENFSKITSKGNSNGGPEYFILELKNGTKIYYGLTSNSKVIGSDNQTPIQWNIEKVEDVNGNYFTYNYIWENNMLRLNEINYTGNKKSNTKPFASIKFRYQEKEDKQSSFTNGKLLEDNLLLREIAIYNKDVLFKKYSFTYRFNLYSYLSEVTESVQNNKGFNSTIFQYGSSSYLESSPVNLVISPASANSGLEYISGDYDGDGFTDLLSLNYTKNNSIKRYHSVDLMINKAEGNLSFNHKSTINIPAGFSIEKTNEFAAFNSLGNFLGGDFNGDGKKDFILTNKSVSGNGSKINGVRIYLSNGEVFAPVDFDFTNFEYNRFNYQAPYIVHLGDFDGDGLTDLGFVLSDGGSYHFIVLTIDGQIKNYGELTVNPSIIDYIYVTDFNGNGKDELFIVQDSPYEYRKTQIVEINKINGVNKVEVIYGSGYPTKGNKLLRVGDFNGDGKTDILHYHDQNRWIVSYYNGKNFASKFIPVTKTILTSDLGNKELRVMDVNGDGKSDIVLLAGTHKVIWYSTGNQFVEKYDDMPWNGNHKDYLLVGDFDGDGRMDELCPTTSNNIDFMKVYYRNKNNNSLLLHKVADGFNNITEFEYMPLVKSEINREFERDYNGYNYTNAKYDVLNLNIPMTLVKKIRKTNPNGGFNEMEYRYKILFFSHQKGILGFHEVYTYNKSTNVTSCSISEPYENDDFPLILPKKEVTYIGKVFNYKENNIFSFQIPSLELNKLGSKKYWIKNMGSHAYTSLNQLHTYNEVDYDEFGNVVYSKTAVGTGDNSLVTEVNSVYEQKNTFIPAHVKSTQTKMTRKNEQPITIHQAFEYDDLGRLNKKILHPNNPKQLTTEYQYDTFGNVIKTTKIADGLPNQKSSIKYDDIGKNVIEKYNSQNQKTTYTYSLPYDLPQSVTNIHNETTNFEYDDFGNLVKTRYANDDIAESNIEWDIQTKGNSNYADQSTLYKVITKGTNQPTSVLWYNRSGLEVKSTTEGLSNTFIKSMAYDNLGRITQATEPYYQGETPIVISTVYDNLGRVVSQGTPTQQQNFAFNYGSETTTLTTTFPDGTTKKTTEDANGLVIKAEDNGGALTYIYYSDGNLKSVSLSGTEMVSLEYDINGNKTKTVDKNAGTYTYQYNAYGLIKQQKNPNNQTNTYSYDNFNRLNNVQTPEGPIVYTYINNGKGLNQIKTINYPNYALTYEYGAFNQISKITEVIDDKTLEYNYEYDTRGSKTALTYPSGFKIKYHYTQRGFLKKITSDNEFNITLWQAEEQNSMGVTNKYLLGNGIQTVKTFDEYKLPKFIQAGNVVDIELDFNPENANLRSRKDKLRNLTEVFTYDNLDRLKESKVNNYTSININYYDNGNIKDKSDAGVYKYHPNKINAVTEVSGENLTDLPQQNITFSSFQSPILIEEGDYALELMYSHNRERKKTTLKQNNQTVLTTYFSGGYEKQVDAQKNQTELHYLNSINTIVVKQNNQYQYYFTYKDNLGTIIAITDVNGNIVEEFNYDAWGVKRNPENWTYELDATASTLTWFKRGYTGHEHLDEFGLINMNSRLYDPQIGRMLSPDNYIQSAGYSQNYNRYSYVWNNPMKYTDPSGDFVAVDSWLVGFVHGFFSTGDGRWSAGWNEANKRAGNDLKIWGGLFVTDPNKNFWGRTGELLSRFTYQLPQTLGGFLTSHTYNTIGLKGGVESVKYKYGATVVKTRGENWGGVAQGSYIVGDNSINADANNPLFQHEYGHYIQSQKMGLAYYPRVGIPSIRSKGVHDLHPVEQDANRRAFLYFNKNIEGFQDDEYLSDSKGWNFSYNKLNVDGSGEFQYIDFNNSNHLKSLNNIKVTAKWYDYTSWFMFPGPIWMGLRNAYNYNN